MFSRSLRKALPLLAVGLALAGPAAAAGQQTMLVIPRLGLDLPVRASLAEGPQIYYRDADTIAIAGHRTTHTHPFLRLDELRRGDTIRLGRNRYVVRRHAVVRPTALWVLRYSGLVLTACHPPGSAAYRYVVFAAPL